MTFAKQLELHLDRILGSSAEKRQRAEACGIDYNYYVMIASGAKNPPSDEKILEIAQKLKLSDREQENQEMSLREAFSSLGLIEFTTITASATFED
ncbi:MAG: hypothetical protein EOM80_19700 [Erysipelotrichia bacterium]|nr:hypothetical protein [Erysipelotrichia bacterium]